MCLLRLDVRRHYLVQTGSIRFFEHYDYEKGCRLRTSMQP
ncbi:hypothetical protein Hoch_1125 [Haliangium ochraceum DSM 14365]|uniref:Uncharacterized protein n=1 Tax=Haliangium ochraceum (strain DSM 14365 / JCM 11303 / SMP-2) TaxID=502025 RepID=D0LS07_HALO1|nr:hypothetical protein Hoch_1125 [Haliangium ochraceum DSM 14365]